MFNCCQSVNCLQNLTSSGECGVEGAGDVTHDVTILRVFQELKISGLLLVMKEIKLNDISLLTFDLPDQTS